MLGDGSVAAVTLGCPDDGTGEWKPISSYAGIAEPPQLTAPMLDQPPPPEQKPKFRWKPIAISCAVLLVLSLVMAGYAQYRRACKAVQDELAEYNKMENQSWATLRTNAINSIYENCSNEVVGLRRVVKVSTPFDGNASNFWGMATCEFVNKVGGVERKDRWFIFDIIPNSSGWIRDVLAQEDPDRFKSDELGLPDAQFKMGVRYMKGMLVWKSQYDADEYFKKSAAQGYQLAIQMLQVEQAAAQGNQEAIDFLKKQGFSPQ